MMSPDVSRVLASVDLEHSKIFVIDAPKGDALLKKVEDFVRSGFKLPFPLCAVVLHDKNNPQVGPSGAVVCIRAADEGGVIAAVLPYRDGHVFESQMTTAQLTPEMQYLVDLKDSKITTADMLARIVGSVCGFLHETNLGGGVAYVSTPNPTNARRKAKGKRPLFTWTTVNLDAPRYINEPKGGTHASPRLHDRRGHWVTSKLGKRFWRKDAKVGSAKNGIAFQTYQKGIESDE
jgi:hypothetical protein